MHKPPYIIKVEKFWWIYRKFYGEWLEGLTIYPFIFMLDPKNERLLRHEKVHIDQQIRGWIIGFYIKYFYYNWKYGYDNNPYEIEARKAEKY